MTLTDIARQLDDDEDSWRAQQPRTISEEQWQRFESHIGEIFHAFGLPAETPGTAATPRRYLRALFDATAGYDGDEKLVTAFPTECPGSPACDIAQIIEGPITFFSLCEHHAFPFFGHAYVGYIAHEHILGISKLTRMVRLFARRFSVQERMGQQLVHALDRVLEPHGVAVHLQAVHLCTQMRGVREHESHTTTTHWSGNYAETAELRSEFMSVARSTVR